MRIYNTWPNGLRRGIVMGRDMVKDNFHRITLAMIKAKNEWIRYMRMLRRRRI